MALQDQLPEKDQGLTEPSQPGGNHLDHTPPKSPEPSSMPNEADQAADKGLQDYAGEGTDKAKDYLADIRERAKNRAGTNGLAKKSNAPKTSFLLRHKKTIIKALAGLVGVFGVIAPIIFFLLLFKNTHFQHLYMDYRLAKFNRSLNSRLKEILDENAKGELKATGDESTSVSPDAPPEQQIADSNAAELSKVEQAGDKGTSQLGQELSSVEQSLDSSTAQKVQTDLGFDRSIDDPMTADDAKAKDVADKETAGDSKAVSENAPKELKDQAEEARKLQDDGKLSARDAATKAVENGKGGFSEFVSKITGPFVILTFYCIFRDIYVTSKDTLGKIVLQGAARVTAITAKTSACQHLGQCSLSTIGATANKFDDAKESATQSCGYARASGAGTGNCKDIDPAYVVNLTGPLLGSDSAAAVIDNILDPPQNIGKAAALVCPKIMNPLVQLAGAAANLIGIFLSGGTLAAAEAVIEGAAAGLATAGGKALAINAVMHYGGGLYKNIKPILFGNLMDMGSKAMAVDTCRTDGCGTLSAKQSAELDTAIRDQLVAEANQKGFFYKFFSPSNDRSITIRVALNMPSSPNAMMGRMGSLFGSLANPFSLAHASSQGALAMGGSSSAALAAIEDNNTYGIPEHGFPDSQINKWKVTENSKWVKDSITDDDKKRYNVCFDAPFEDYITAYDTKTNQFKHNEGKPDFTPCNENAPDGKLAHYRQYRFDQKITHALALRFNKSSDNPSSGNGGTTSTPGTPGPVYMLGDSITLGIKNAGLETQLQSKGWNPTAIDGSTSRSITAPGQDNNRLNGLDAVTADASSIQLAKVIVVGLGTNPGGSVDLTGFASNIDTLIDKIRVINPSAPIFWVNLVSTSSPQYPQRNQVISQEGTKKNYSVIDARSANIPLGGDGIHPSSAGYASMTTLIVAKITGAP